MQTLSTQPFQLLQNYRHSFGQSKTNSMHPTKCCTLLHPQAASFVPWGLRLQDSQIVVY
jgi:hypothetical protein